MTRLRLLVVSVLVVAMAVPTAAGAQDLDTVVEQREATGTALEAAEIEFDRLVTELEAAEYDLDHMQDEVVRLEAEAAALDQSLADRARALYKRSEPALFSILGADDPAGAVRRAGMLAAVQRREVGQLESAVAVRTQLEQVRVLLQARQAEFGELVDAADAAREQLAAQFGDLVELEDDLRRRDARKQELLTGQLNGIYACIYDPGRFQFRDTWGAPRGGGRRRHKGTDVFAAMGEPVFAITDGYLSRLNSSAVGGTSIYLRGDDGHLYYYTHLQGYASGAFQGKRVEAGEHIAYNGATGNARGGAPHVHFQYHPFGGAPVNPYPTLATLCYGR